MASLWKRLGREADNRSWENEGFPGYVAVAVGNFADPIE
jgi:hypothetical protein